MKVQGESTREDIALIEKQEEMNRQFTDGTYITLVKVLADWTGKAIQKMTRGSKPLPFWYNMTVIILSVQVIAYLIAIAFDESPFLSSQAISLVVPLSALSLIFAIAFENYLGVFLTTTRNHVLPAIISIEDIVDLRTQLASVFSFKAQLLFTMIYSILLTVAGIFFAITLAGGASIDGILAVLALNFVGGIYFYFAVRGLPILLRFSQYQFKLYTADPSKSELIDRLSDTLSAGLYIVAIWAALYSLLLMFSGGGATVVIPFIIITAWVPVTAFFVVSQYSMSRIIKNAKWRTLNNIQAQVEALQQQENVLSETTLDHVDKLIAYHDRIAMTRNSALDVRAGLNFLNSLLLPLIAFFLANFDLIIQSFANRSP